MQKKILGLDVGLASIGWAVTEMEESDTRILNGEILGAGVRVFTAAEGEKGAPPAQPRRIARSQRRRLRRRGYRLERIRLLFVRQGLLQKSCLRTADGHLHIDKNKIAELHRTQNQTINPWQLRLDGLTRKLKREEWIAVLTHLAIRRGYKSNRREMVEIEVEEINSKDDKEMKKEKEEKKAVLSAIKENKAAFQEGDYETIGEMMMKDSRFRYGKRNKKADGQPVYRGVVPRELLEREVITLFEKQRQLKNPFTSDKFRDEYLSIWCGQRSFDQGDIAKMVGDCTFEEGEKRAARESFSSEYFSLLQTIRNQAAISSDSGNEIYADEAAIFELVRYKKEISYKDLRKICKLGCGDRFKGVFYRAESKQFEKKIQSLRLMLSKSGQQRVLSLITDETRRISYKQIKKSLALPDSVTLSHVKHATTNNVFFEFSGDETNNKEIEQFKKELKNARFSPTEIGQKKASDHGSQTAVKGQVITFENIRQWLSLPDWLCFKNDEKKVKFDERKSFFKFERVIRVRKAVVSHLCESRWNEVTANELQKELLLEAALFGRDESDRRKFLRRHNVNNDLVDAVANLSIPDKDEEGKKFHGMPGWHKVKNAFKEDNNSMEVWERLQNISDEDAVQALDTIAIAATLHKDEKTVCEYLDEHLPASFSDCAEIVKQATLKISMRGFSPLSLKALRKITPYLEKGEAYDEACKSAGYNHSSPQIPAARSGKLSPAAIDACNIRNPRVIRALAQARKVINAVNRQYGPFHRIHIELLRDLARNWSDRQKIKTGQAEFSAAKDDALKLFHEHYGKSATPSGGDLIKIRLWKEQSGFSPYSDNDGYIDIRRLHEDGYVQIDHILPRSRSMDNSMTNKVLCFSWENQEKGDRIPYEWFGRDSGRWESFCARTKYYRTGRREKLHRRSFTQVEAQEHREKWVDGAESKWIARELKNLLERHLLFAEGDDGVKVQTRNGAFTGFLRAQWGLHKDRKDDLHHAVDAMVLAVSTQAMVKQVMDWSKQNELWASNNDEAAETVDEETGEIQKTKYRERRDDFKRFELWEGFRDQVLEQKRKVIVSRPPVCKFSGKAHEATIKSVKNLKKSDFEKLVRGGEPGGWKILRADVFSKNGKFYISLVRPYHYTRGQLPNKLISEHPLPVDKSFSFKFSLFSGDAVMIRAKAKRKWLQRFPPTEKYAGVFWSDDKKVISVIGYYRTTNSRNGQITIEAHDRSWGRSGDFHPGIRYLLALEKLSIPILGDINLDEIINKGKFIVRKEKRRELAKPRSRKPNRT